MTTIVGASASGSTHYQFLVDAYATEIIKVLSVWSMFDDGAFPHRPHPTDSRGRSVHEQLVHQCVSEHLWFVNMLGISVTDSPLPADETRQAFMAHYATCAERRLDALRAKNDDWWMEDTQFFEMRRSRAWVMTRRLTHTAHHRGQQTTMVRMLNRELHSTYGPTADTGGLMQHHAPVIYAYKDVAELVAEERAGRRKASLPGPGTQAPTERPVQ